MIFTNLKNRLAARRLRKQIWRDAMEIACSTGRNMQVAVKQVAAARHHLHSTDLATTQSLPGQTQE